MGPDSAVESGVNSAEDSVDNGSELCNLPLSSRASSERLNGRSDYSISDIDIEMRNLSLQQSHLSQSDPNIYHSSTRHSTTVSRGEILESLQSRGSRSSLECQDSRSCSQSTQSTSTSAEFSLGNVNSVCDENLESPENVINSQIGDQVYSNLNNSKEFRDSEFSCEGSLYKGSGEPGVHAEESTVLPSANLPGALSQSTENWDEECNNTASGSCEFDETIPSPEIRRYFKAEYVKSEESLQRSKYIVMIFLVSLKVIHVPYFDFFSQSKVIKL